MRLRKTLGAAAVGMSIMVGGFVAAGSAFADGSETASWCGGNATFKTVGGLAQVQYIVDTNGKRDSTHNGGCFGIAPSGSIWWIPLHGTSWLRMPGNGVAEKDAGSYVGGFYCETACSSAILQTITVETAAGNYYSQQYHPGSGWNGTWIRNYL